MKLKDWFELVDYRITEGSEFYSGNYPGPGSYSLSSWDGNHDGSSFNVVFNTHDQEVFLMEACDYKNNRAYRFINPDWIALHGLGPIQAEIGIEAWDNADFIDLEVYEDFLEKCYAIKNGESYDTRIKIPLTLDDSEMLELMKCAHENDMTLNDYVEMILRKYIEDYE